MSRTDTQEPTTTRAEAATQWVRDYLTEHGGRAPAMDVYAAGHKAGYVPSTLKAGRKASYDVIAVKEGKCWVWQLVNEDELETVAAAHPNRLSYTDRATGQVVRRYEHPYPGSLVHVDVKKIGNIPDGGGWRYVGARQGARNRASTPGKARSQASRRPVMGYACVHSVIDDYSRVVYSEIHDDEKADTAVGVLQRAVSWFSARGVKVERVLSDNGSAYRSQAWQAACQDLGIKARHTRPYRPQTNGKIERFHRTLADGWAYARHYTSETQRRQALPAWLHLYNHHRPHTATQGHPPITRLTNLPDQYT